MTCVAPSIPKASPELVSTQEAAARIGVTEQTFSKWVRRGLIAPVVKGRQGGKSHWFDLQDVLRLSVPQRIKRTRSVTDEDLVTTRQIHELFQVSPTTLWKLVKAGKLEVVARQGAGVGQGTSNFYRLSDVRRAVDEISVAHPAAANVPTLVSIREASALLSIKERTLESWRTKGWITPLAFQQKHRKVLRYDLGQLRAFVATRTHGKDARTESDDAVLSTYKAEKATGISKHKTIQWLSAGLLKPVRKGTTGSYYRVGDLRRIRNDVECARNADDDDYFSYARSYYASMGAEAREIVHAMVAAYKGDDESPEYVMCDAIAMVMASLHCGQSCCSGCDRNQRIQKLRNFDTVHIHEPSVDRSYTDPSADDFDDDHAYSLLLTRDREWQRERDAWLKERRELLWLRMSRQYRRWARDYYPRLRSYESVAA